MVLSRSNVVRCRRTWACVVTAAVSGVRVRRFIVPPRPRRHRLIRLTGSIHRSHDVRHDFVQIATSRDVANGTHICALHSSGSTPLTNPLTPTRNEMFNRQAGDAETPVCPSQPGSSRTSEPAHSCAGNLRRNHHHRSRPLRDCLARRHESNHASPRDQGCSSHSHHAICAIGNKVATNNGTFSALSATLHDTWDRKTKTLLDSAATTTTATASTVLDDIGCNRSCP